MDEYSYGISVRNGLNDSNIMTIRPVNKPNF